MTNSRDFTAAQMDLEYIRLHEEVVVKQYGFCLFNHQLHTALQTLKNVASCIIADDYLNDPDFEEYKVSRFCNDTLEINVSKSKH